MNHPQQMHDAESTKTTDYRIGSTATHNPNVIEAINDRYQLEAKYVKRERGNLKAQVDIHTVPDEEFIFGAQVVLGSDLGRKKFTKSVVEKVPSLPSAMVEDALLRTYNRLSTAAEPESTLETKPPTDEEIKAWRRKAQPLLEAPDLLGRVDAALHDLGVVGEYRARRLLYLATVARLLDDPVSVFLKGPSSSGKSYVMANVIKLLPESAYIDYSSISPRYLAYCQDDLRHRIVVLYEAGGLAAGDGAYLMRSLLSEHRVRLGSVAKNGSGAQKAFSVDREGPTALFTTTCLPGLDEELETRALTETTTDNHEQSRAVLIRTADKWNGLVPRVVDLEPFHALQEWLAAAGERRVLIPFAADLADRIPCRSMRVRRDFGKLMSLLAASAILHQEQRERAADGQIVATLDDYRIARELMVEAFTAAQHEGLTGEQREAVQIE